MITASHNPECDNGVKIIDPSGGMLDSSWEDICTSLANEKDENLENVIKELVNKFSVDWNEQAKVHVARDTRSSSESLSQALITGVQSSGGQAIDEGLLTTPQLHYIIRCINSNQAYGQATETGYYEKLSKAYLALSSKYPNTKNYSSKLVVDGANGIGALQMKKFSPLLSSALEFVLIHDENGILNHDCGADFVKVQQREPVNIKLEAGVRYASFDGDADRIIYYYQNSQDGKFHMLDGDKIAVLVAKYLQGLLTKANLNDISVSIIQTAYANGASTIYMRDVLKMETFCVPTGVKYLHHKAEQCQIGVYFEANGHGTILFSEETEAKLKSVNSVAANELLQFIDIVNQTVGDAISDMLVVEIILQSLDMNIEQWDAFYTDLPSRLMKQAVKDRNVVNTTDAERKCVTPPGLQDAIDKTIVNYGPRARSFVRPSGTEDVVRIYSEADTQNDADRLAKEITNLVIDFANGIGDKYVL